MKKETITYLDGFADGLNMANNSTNKMLDKIREEIERQEKWLMDAGYNQYNVDIAFNAIKLVIDKYEAEMEIDNGKIG